MTKFIEPYCFEGGECGTWVCDHCNKVFPTHALYDLGIVGGRIAHPCLPEVVFDPKAVDVLDAEAKANRLASGTFVPLSDVLGIHTQAVRDYFINLGTNPLLTPKEQSLVLLCRFDECRVEHVHFLIDALFHWMEHNPQGEPISSGSHLGTVGERIELDIMVTRIVGPFAGEYGDSYLCAMETSAGDRVVWWTGENLSFEEGAPYSIRGTVKKHDEYDGQKQTHLTRVKEVKK